MFGLQNGTKETLKYIDNRMDSFTTLVRSCFKEQVTNAKEIENLKGFAAEVTKALSAMSETIKSMQLTIANTLEIQEMLISSVEIVDKKTSKTPKKTSTKNKGTKK